MYIHTHIYFHICAVHLPILNDEQRAEKRFRIKKINKKTRVDQKPADKQLHKTYDTLPFTFSILKMHVILKIMEHISTKAN